MENFSILTINLLYIIGSIIGMTLTAISISSFSSLNMKKSILTFALGFACLVSSVLITGQYHLKTNLSSYEINVVTNRLEVYSLNKNAKTIIDDSIVFEEYSKLAKVKCNWLETYTECLTKFKNKEVEIISKSFRNVPNSFVSLTE